MSLPDRAIDCVSQLRYLLDPSSVRVGFVADKVALIHGFPSVLLFCPVSMIPPMLCNYIFFIHPQPKTRLIRI